MADERIPVAVLGARRFHGVTAGGSHTCGVSTSGTAFCWGNNAYGQLGDGTDRSHRRPVRVSGGGFRQLSTGTFHTCGIGADGLAYCWGNNSGGQLGDGSTDDRRLPTVPQHLKLLGRELVAVVIAARNLGFVAFIGLVGPVILMAAYEGVEGGEIAVPLIRGRELRH